MSHRFRAVLFDFSATLFDPTRVVDGPALASRARQRGIDLDEANAQRLAAGILEYADTPAGQRLRAGCDLSAQRYRRAWLGLAAQVPGVGPRLAEAFYDCLVDPSRWLPYQDTRAALCAVRAAGLRIAVVSNCGWDLRRAFAHHGLSDLVDGYVLSYEHGRVKPDPALFRLACERLRVAPATALMVGDDPGTDVGALAAGVATYLLPPAGPGQRTRGLGAVLALSRAATAGRIG